MAVHHIRKGLDLPISGPPEQRIHTGAAVSRVALMADDYPFMKPRMHVSEGDTVRRGQLLFEDRKTAGVRFTSPAGGTVVAINRGDRRALQSVVVGLSPGECSDQPDEDELQSFTSFTGSQSGDLEREAVVELLVESGLWTAIRRRPFSNVPSPQESCAALLVTAMDSNPLSPAPEVVLEQSMADFHNGLQVLAKLADTIFLCRRAGSSIDSGGVPGVKVEDFKGPHPAGLAGTHIHFLAPVDGNHPAWYVGYQDVVAMGRLFTSGVLDPRRVVALAGPPLKQPRLLTTRVGASLDELLAAEDLPARGLRVVSGSVLHGRKAMGEVWGYLGRFSNQVSVLAEDRKRRFLSWVMPGFDIYSIVRAYASRWIGKKSFDFTTSGRGGHRAMVPIGGFEKVMPLDVMPTFLLRALVGEDLERAEALGCLELDEEDLALCSFVSPGKEDFGIHLRRVLTQIWKEG